MIKFVFIVILLIICTSLNYANANFQVVHFLDPSASDTLYYSSWNSDQWVKWLRDKYDNEAEDKRSDNIVSEESPKFKGSWANIVITVTREDFNTAYASDSVHTYTDPQKSDYFWSDYAFPVFVILRSPNATVNVTEEEAVTGEEQQTHRRILYGYKVFNCDGGMFVNSKTDSATFIPIRIKTFFPRKVKNPQLKLKLPLSVCKTVSQTRGLLDEIRFQLGAT